LLTLYQKGKLDRKPYPNPNPEGKRDTIYHYWTSVDNFTDKGEKRMAKKPKKAKPVLDGAVRSSVPEPMGLPVFVAPTFDPQAFVAGLNVHDAKEVYLLLKDVFE
jgi:hypothetical protein